MKFFKVLIALVVAAVLFFGGKLFGNHQSAGTAASMPAGTYYAYSTQKRFNHETGEPVYWVIGQRIEVEEVSGGGNNNVPVPVRQGAPKLYEVSRKRITNLVYDAGVDPNYNVMGEIIVQ